MADAPEEPEKPPTKASKIPLILGVLLAALGAGGGYYATTSGMILNNAEMRGDASETIGNPGTTTEDVAYIEVDPLTVSLRSPSASQHLRFRASLEVLSSQRESVVKVLPRVTDVLNSYLRALDPEDLEDPAALARLRGQMLRRVQIVAGLGTVNDILIMEFVLN